MNKITNINIYTDGSFHTGKSNSAGWAWIAVQKEKIIGFDSGVTEYPAISCNIDGEVHGVIQACEWLDKCFPESKVKIFVDYIGLIYWANRNWHAKSLIAKKYVDFIETYLPRVIFSKIESHSRNSGEYQSHWHIHWSALAEKLSNYTLKKQYDPKTTIFGFDLVEKDKKVCAV